MIVVGSKCTPKSLRCTSSIELTILRPRSSMYTQPRTMIDAIYDFWRLSLSDDKATTRPITAACDRFNNTSRSAVVVTPQKSPSSTTRTSHKESKAAAIPYEEGEVVDLVSDDEEVIACTDTRSSTNEGNVPKFPVGTKVEVVSASGKSTHEGKTGTVLRHTAKMVCVQPLEPGREFKVQAKNLRQAAEARNLDPSPAQSNEEFGGRLASVSDDAARLIYKRAVLLAKKETEEAQKRAVAAEDLLKCPVCHEYNPEKMLLFVRCGHRLCDHCYANHPRPVTYDRCGWRKTHPIKCHTCRKVVKKATRKDGIVQIHY